MKVELDKALKKIRKEKAKTVLLQLPEGLKPKALKFADKIEEKTKATVFIWAGSCFGACDIPKLDLDLLIQVGHTPLI